MLAPNWEDHNLETNPIINLFADRNHTEMVFKNVENKVKKRCFYCQKCKNCKTFQEYIKVFKQKGFWTFNKNVKNWNVNEPMWCKTNIYLKIVALK